VTHPLASIAAALARRGVRYAVIGVSGANLYAPAGQAIFTTEDIDLFLPPDPQNLAQAWAACEELAYELWLGDEPLDRPRDKWLAERVVERRALTRASGPEHLLVDLTLVMKGYEFETVWGERRMFVMEGVDVPTARLLHIVTSKQAAGRPKDQLFLATHQDALAELLKPADRLPPRPK
jgi:hypothetical protein